jgi:hypothetical protein
MKNKIIIFLVGLLFLGVAVFMYYRGNALSKRCTKEVTATVIEVIEKINSDSDGVSYLYYPKFEYNVRGEKIIKEGSDGSFPSKYVENQKVQLLYNPDKPTEFVVKGEKESLIIPIVFGVLGILMLVGGFISKNE